MNRLFKQNIEGFLFTRSHEHIQLLKQLLLETLLKTKIELLEKTTKLGDDMNNVICLPQIQQVFIYLYLNTKVIIFGVLLFLYICMILQRWMVFDKLFDGDEWMSFYG